ncbi:hypothetical protein HNP86_001727 [Methanococcus maripaludis]|uniref:Thoeris protein ThsB TIR-like domain-containing protein n=1 Tax=Methanococcus maripaludis TaxID=39152 RepID=A0A7J9NWD3_METMI|nr:TIR domain-containing protein [Methanococcus maripaludis]MBA2851574.1 hypothetical protein [Methanococcus maripaludis]
MVHYRTGTYVAFNGCGTRDPTASDIKYFNLLKAWDSNKNFDFNMKNSHAKTSQVKDSSSLKTLQDRLVLRMKKSKNMLVIVSKKSKENRGLLSFEIEKAIGLKMPIIMAYSGMEEISDIQKLSKLWPKSLKESIGSKTVKTIHIPFKREFIGKAVEKYHVRKMPRNYITILKI